MTLDEVGQQLGLTRERVRQISGKALRKISIWYRKHHGGFRYESTKTSYCVYTDLSNTKVSEVPRVFQGVTVTTRVIYNMKYLCQLNGIADYVKLARHAGIKRDEAFTLLTVVLPQRQVSRDCIERVAKVLSIGPGDLVNFPLVRYE